MLMEKGQKQSFILYFGILYRVSALKHFINATTYIVGFILVAKYLLTSKTLDLLLGLDTIQSKYPILT